VVVSAGAAARFQSHCNFAMSILDSELSPQARAYCDAVRRQIEQEDNLIVNRLSWLVASQSFLFTGYAIVLNGPVLTRNEVFTARQDALLRIIPIMALACCVLIYLGVIAGIHVMAVLHRDMKEKHYTPSGLMPPIQGTPLTLALGRAAPLGLPPIFAIAWIALLRG